MHSPEYGNPAEFFRYLPSIKSIGELVTVLRSDQSLLANPSLSDLDSFFAGFAYGNSLQEIHADFATLDGFAEWLQEKYSLSPTRGWCSIIQSISESDTDGLALFWKLFDEYSQSKSEETNSEKGQAN